MAILTFTIPSSFQPAYNECVLTFTSNQIAKPGFRFILRVEDANQGYAEIARFAIVPRIGDGLGYQDVKKIAQDLLTYNYPTGLFADGLPKQVATLRFLIGEEYQTAYTYSGITQNGLYVRLTGTSVPTYVAGDQIEITQNDGGVAMPNMTGLFTVISVAGNNVTISRLWAEVTPAAVGGSVIYADRRKTQFLNQFDETIDLYNAAFSFKDFQSYVPADWKLTDGTTKKMLTDIPRARISITPTQDVFAMLYGNTMTGNTYKVAIRAGNAGGIQGNYSYIVTANNVMQMIRLAGDFTGVTVDSGVLPVIKPDTTTLDVRVTTIGGITSSETIRFTIDQRCKIEDYEVLFLDRKGSWGSFAFQLKKKASTKATKKTYQQELGTVTNTGFSYQLNDVGTETYNVEANGEIELNTNFMDEDTASYFQQLITSPKTYLKINGAYYAYDVITTTSEDEDKKNNPMIRKTITMKPSNEIEINI